MATNKKASKPVKKAVPAKKAAPAKKTVPAKKAAPVKKAAPAKKAAPKAAPKKAAPAKKATKPSPKPAPKVAAKPVPKPAAKAVVKPTPQKGKTAAPAAPKKVEVKKAEVKKPEVKKPEPKKPEVKKAAPAPKAEPVAVAAPPPPPAKKKAEPAKPTKVVIPEIKTKTVRKYEPGFTKSVLDQVVEIETGPSMRYSDADLQEFKELIQKKLDSAKKELAYLQGLITRKDEMGGDETDNRYMTMEDGSLSMEREQLAQMASRQITFMDHLEKALMRIENKTYGICRKTGKLIDKARLRAVPHATLSMEAKQSQHK